MPSALVSRFRNDVAPRLMAKFANGGTSTVVRVVMPNHDPLLPPMTQDSPVEFNAIAFGISPQMIAADPNLLATDLRVICAAIDFTPVVGGMVEINGKSRGIQRVEPLPASGDPAIYKFYVR